MVSEEVPNEMKNRLVREFHPQGIILFGSQARKNADERSDVDLLIICSISGNRRALMVAMDRDLKGLPIARDRHIPGTVARPAWKEGKALYESP